MYSLARSLLFKLDAEKAHHFTLDALNKVYKLGLLPIFDNRTKPVKLMGINLPNPVGLAAGLDKNGEYIDALGALGFGFLEIGTVTPKPQPGNPQPRLFRLVEDKAVINRMGFNNDGAAAAGPRVAAARADLETEYRGAVRPVIGVNIGKTKVVELANAIEDYLISTRTLAPQADYLVVNVSSPNTPGLRTLQAIESLRPLLAAVREEADRVCPNRHVPLTVKIAPDLVDEDIIEVAALAKELKLDGIIATNTTIAREGLGLTSDMTKVKEIGAGGLSGAPLKPRSLEVLRLLKREIGDDLAIISVGGVTTAEDVQERLDAGADLVQGYTAFLYEGPLWAAHINRGLVKLRRARR